MPARLSIAVLSLSIAVSGAGQAPRSSSLPRGIIAALQRIVDSAQSQQLEGDAAIGWDAHFLKGPDGRTYVPFTVAIPAAHDAVAVYMRVVQRAGMDDATSRALLGSLLSQGAIGLEAMRDARRMTLARTVFQDAVRISTDKGEDGGRVFRTAVVVPPGLHDFYVAIGGRDGKSREKTLLLKRPLAVPQFPEKGLCLSSILRVERVEPLPAPLREAERIIHPYVVGQSEIITRATADFRSSDTLTVAFFVYNADPGDAGKPDVEITYRLFRAGFAGRLGIGETTQRLNQSTLPGDFDLRAGHQLAAMQSLPLESYAPGDYTLDIIVTDHRTGARAPGQIPFSIWR